MLALIAGTVPYLHMRALVELYGQPACDCWNRPNRPGAMIAASANSEIPRPAVPASKHLPIRVG